LPTDDAVGRIHNTPSIRTGQDRLVARMSPNSDSLIQLGQEIVDNLRLGETVRFVRRWRESVRALVRGFERFVRLACLVKNLIAEFSAGVLGLCRGDSFWKPLPYHSRAAV
jgi:hypothetical protein